MTRDRAHDTFYARAIADSRSTLHLSYRLVIRATQLLDFSAPAGTGAGPWRLALSGFVVLDIVLWIWLRRSKRFGLGPRLLLDGLDIAFMSLSPALHGGKYDSCVLIGIPLSVEAGFRLGGAGLIVPVAGLTITGVARVAAGRAVFPSTFLWLVLGVGIGMALYLYCRRLQEEAESERARVLVAEERRSFLAGQNSVAMGASSVVDAIQGIIPVLGTPRPGSALWELAAGWKARLGETTQATSTYLQVTLLEWQRRHNRHPDLSAHVVLDLDEGAGTTLLTASQAAWLHGTLDRLEVRGRVRIAPVAPGGPSRPPGASFPIMVGREVVVVPVDRDAAQRPVDPAPVTFLLIAAQCVSLAMPDGSGVPFAAVVVLVLVCLVGGWWSHQRLFEQGLSARPAVLAAAVTVATVITTVGTLAAGHPVGADGRATYVGVGLMLLAYVGGFYSHAISPRLLGGLAGGVTVNALLAIVLFPAPVNLRSFAMSIASSLAPFPTACHISRSLAKALEEHALGVRDRHASAQIAAFRRGQESVMELVRRARGEARHELGTVGPTLAGPLAALVELRLEEVDRRLHRMELDPVSSS